MASQREKQESRTLMMRGICTVGDGGEEPTTSAEAEKEKLKRHTRLNSWSAGKDREGRHAGEIGKKSWSQPRTLSTKHSPGRP